MWAQTSGCSGAKAIAADNWHSHAVTARAQGKGHPMNRFLPFFTVLALAGGPALAQPLPMIAVSPALDGRAFPASATCPATSVCATVSPAISSTTQSPRDQRPAAISAAAAKAAPGHL